MPLQAPGMEEKRRTPGERAERRPEHCQADQTRPDKSISGTSNPITAKPTRPDESISGTSNPITAKPTLKLTPNPDADVHTDLLSKALAFLIWHFSCGRGCRGKDHRLRRLASLRSGVREKVDG